MNRQRLGSVVVAVLAVLALAVGAAVIDTPTRTAGTGGGSGGGSGGFFGHGSGAFSSQPVQNVPPIGGFPKIVLQVLIVALVIAYAVSLYLKRDEIGLRELRNGAIVVAFLGVLLVGGYLLLRWFDGSPADSGGGGGTGGNASAVAGGGAGGVSDTAFNPVSTTLPLLVLAVGVVLVVGVGLALRAGSDDDPTDPESELTDTTTMADVGRAAGRAADRIADDGTVENEVYRAWREMTTQLEMDNPDSRTPGEFARAATDAGMKRSDVAELTDLFRTVRYGDDTITGDRERRAVAALGRIEDAYAEDP